MICLSVLRLAACLAGLLHWFLFVVLIASNCAVFPDFLFGAWWSWRDLFLHDDLHLLNGGTLSLAHFPFWTRPMGTGAAPHGPGHQAGPPMPSQWNQGHPGVPASQCRFRQDKLVLLNNDLECPSQLWQLRLLPVAPHPQVQGTGLAGMMPSFPPPPPFWATHQNPGHLRLSNNAHGFPTPPRPSHPPTSGRTTPRTPSTKGKPQTARTPNISLGQHWKQDEEHYDNQKVNGLTLPTTIKASSWTQLKDIEGCDPLTVPLSKLRYQSSEKFCLRKLATGREVYVATMGEVSQVVFVSEMLSQIRNRGIDLDRLAQHKALQDGHSLEKREAIQYINKLLDTGSQHEIAELQAKIAALGAAANQAPTPSLPAQLGASNSNRVQTPIEAALQGQRPAAFDPAQLLVTPGSTNQWLENNILESFSDSE